MPRLKSNQSGFSLIGLCATVLILAGLVVLGHRVATSHDLNSSASKAVSSVVKSSPSTQASTAPNPCSGNSLNQLALVSISARKVWACDYQVLEYTSPVITGMESLPSDLTPTGTYHIYAKIVNYRLIGSDSTGSWNDFVYYWMPFMNNQYGIYGFHDATWRSSSEFGNVSPYSKNASHGCVELPLATAKWLFNWSVIGTTVTIEA